MSSNSIDYQALMDKALRGVVRDALRACSHGSLPPGHYFYITFKTQAPGVEMSEALIGRYPDVMTIVLQHQFWDLKIRKESFSVGLSFSSVPHMLHIPFSAVVAFADPPAEFGLRFGPPDEPFGSADESSVVDPFADSSNLSDDVSAPSADGGYREAEVVSIDAFRKK